MWTAVAVRLCELDFGCCPRNEATNIMPEICRFYGIVIGMFYDEHRPPHFHVRYGEHEAVIRIKDLLLTEGHLPPRTLGLVVEWAAKHRAAFVTELECD